MGAHVTAGAGWKHRRACGAARRQTPPPGHGSSAGVGRGAGDRGAGDVAVRPARHHRAGERHARV